MSAARQLLEWTGHASKTRQAIRAVYPCAPPQVVPEYLWRAAYGFAPVVAEQTFDHGGLRCRHRRELHTAAGACAAGRAGSDLVAAQSRGWDCRLLYRQSADDGADLLLRLSRRRLAAALPPAPFRVSSELELAPARPGPRREAVAARLPGLWHRQRVRRTLCARAHLAAGDHAPLPHA